MMRRRTLLVAVVMATCFFALTLSVLTPYYETNDDAVMNLIASGQLCHRGSPPPQVNYSQQYRQ